MAALHFTLWLQLETLNRALHFTDCTVLVSPESTERIQFDHFYYLWFDLAENQHVTAVPSSAHRVAGIEKEDVQRPLPFPYQQ